MFGQLSLKQPWIIDHRQIWALFGQQNCLDVFLHDYHFPAKMPRRGKARANKPHSVVKSTPGPPTASSSNQPSEATRTPKLPPDEMSDKTRKIPGTHRAQGPNQGHNEQLMWLKDVVRLPSIVISESLTRRVIYFLFRAMTTSNLEIIKVQNYAI